jgi:HAD superfamily hydrolase (TIGR01490 family)
MPATPSAEPGTIAAFFDVDNTIIRGASAFHLARALRQRGLLTGRAIAAFAWSNLRYQLWGERSSEIEATRSRALAIINGMPVAQVLVVGEQVYDEVLAHRIFPGTKELLDRHLEQGHEVWLVSATPVEVGEQIAQKLGATGALGTVAEHRDGRYTGRLNGDLMHGAAKSEAVTALAAERGIDLARSYAYGDSINDVPLLATVGNPCAINPDRKLRAYCARRRWPVREFRDRRRAVRRSLRAASRVGAAWATWAVIRTALKRLR